MTNKTKSRNAKTKAQNSGDVCNKILWRKQQNFLTQATKSHDANNKILWRQQKSRDASISITWLCHITCRKSRVTSHVSPARESATGSNKTWKIRRRLPSPLPGSSWELQVVTIVVGVVIVDVIVIVIVVVVTCTLFLSLPNADVCTKWIADQAVVLFTLYHRELDVWGFCRVILIDKAK